MFATGGLAFGRKKILLTLLLALIFFPTQQISAQEDYKGGEEAIFKAEVLEILDETTELRDDGVLDTKQKLKLRGLEGVWKNKDFIYEQPSYDILSTVKYKVGDKVVVSQSLDTDGNNIFYIINFVRTSSIYWLTGLFVLIVILVGRFKGIRALFVLAITFAIILKFIIPKILEGNDPVFITIIGLLAILLVAIYITEGFSRISNIAVLSILISLLITAGISVFFTKLSRLNGFASEDVMFLVSSNYGSINLQGLLLAGILIGALGVLDDVVISQILTVKQIKKANPYYSKKELYKESMEVGVSHLSSMVNTLFLAYAGVSLPLLLLFSINPLLSYGNILNNEVVTTEIVRALTGSIGLILAVPIATLLAINFLKNEESRKDKKIKFTPTT